GAVPRRRAGGAAAVHRRAHHRRLRARVRRAPPLLPRRARARRDAGRAMRAGDRARAAGALGAGGAAERGAGARSPGPAGPAHRFPASEERTREPGPPMVAVACLPLTVEGRALGGLAFAFDGERGFDDDERLFLQLLARHCAEAIERARLYAKLRDASGTLEA